jgi:hypothetical protein
MGVVLGGTLRVRLTVLYSPLWPHEQFQMSMSNQIFRFGL